MAYPTPDPAPDPAPRRPVARVAVAPSPAPLRALLAALLLLALLLAAPSWTQASAPPADPGTTEQDAGEPVTGEETTGDQTADEETTGDQTTGEETTDEQATDEQATDQDTAEETDTGQQDTGEETGEPASGEEGVDASPEVAEESGTVGNETADAVRAPELEIVSREADAITGKVARLTVEVLANNDAPLDAELLLAGPNRVAQFEDGDEPVEFEALQPGTYLLAVTAEGNRVSAGTVTLEPGEAVAVVARLYDDMQYHADAADTLLFGLIEIDVADQADEDEGDLMVVTEPSATIAVVGPDGFAERYRATESLELDGLDEGSYVVAVTRANGDLAVARAEVVGTQTTRLRVGAAPDR